MAKLQILKQNTDPNDRKDNETQTGQSKMARMFRTEGRCNTNPRQHSSTGSRLPLEMRTSDLLGSPQGRHSYRQSSSAGETSSTNRTDNGQKFCRHTQGARSNQKHLDSGKSSDSSISSAHGYRRLQEGGSLRIGSSSHQQRKGATGDSSYVMLQGSSSSHNIPHVAIPIVDQKHNRHQQYPNQMLSYSISNSSDLAGCVAGAHSISTPQLKKKLSSETSLHGTLNSNILKHQSFDYSGTQRDPSTSSISLTRSGSFMSSSGMSARHQPTQNPTNSTTISQQRASSIDGNGASDDSMHEKYFKSVENTPVSRRRQTVSNSTTTNSTKLIGQRQGSSDSSPHSPTSPHNNSSLVKTARPTLLKTLAMEQQPSSFNSSHKNEQELLNLDLTSKPERYLDKMKLDKTKIISPSAISNSSSVSSTTNLIKKSLNKNISSPSSQQKQQQQQQTNEFNIQQFLTKPNLERHNKEKHRNTSTTDKTSTHNRNKQKKQQQLTTTGTIGGGGGSDVEYDNGNISPLYTNWDQEMQEHLLPLQHYILEQAKLSGCYRLGGGSGGDPQDSDSFHSDSQSEHSFSGHEPDNEDSDHSDGRGDYLTHNYVVDDYGAHRGGGGATYFNVDFDKNDREDM